jgi:DNA-binding NarL/FixJ family response regulator
MPGMSGVQLALTFTTSFPDCKVLLFSGTATARDMEPAISAGIEFPMLSKPVHPTQIIDYISRSLAKGCGEALPIVNGVIYPTSFESV